MGIDPCVDSGNSNIYTEYRELTGDDILSKDCNEGEEVDIAQVRLM